MPTTKLVDETSTRMANRTADMERITFIGYPNLTEFLDFGFIVYDYCVIKFLEIGVNPKNFKV